MHQLFIATSLKLLLPVIQTIFLSVPRFSIRRKKNLQKLIVIFLDQNHRNLTPQKLPVIRYWFEKHSFYSSIDHLHISHFVSKIIHLTVISLYGRQFTNYFKIILKNWCPVHCPCLTKYNFTCRKGNNSYKKGMKTCNFRIKSGMDKRFIDKLYTIHYCLTTFCII